MKTGKFSRKGLLRITVAILTGIGGAGAQDSALQRRDHGIERALPTVRAVPTDAPPQPVADGQLGEYGEQELLARPPHWLPWTVSASAGFDSQSNPGLAPQGSDHDWLLRGTTGIRGTFPLNGNLYLDSGVGGQTVRYDRFRLLDYDRVDADLGLLEVLPQDWPVVGGDMLSVRGAWYRLSEGGRLNELLFDNFSVVTGYSRNVVLNPHHSLSFGLVGDMSLNASEPSASRDDYSIMAVWLAQWSPQWETHFFGRAALYDYSSHKDLNSIAGLGVDRVLSPWCRLGAVITFTNNHSDHAGFSYNNWSVGPVLRFSLRF